ncbi:hypothetical protein L596_018838 [Steinernema carpocapsae]|uniref:Uncharacterized protein n=1 Tax=Steinernema carpocapsae TaxID=34508 RepID=A0A4U5N6Y1_STECR|nr:hypothetical protein L596_018838 [Steinernema carpocapsae]
MPSRPAREPARPSRMPSRPARLGSARLGSARLGSARQFASRVKSVCVLRCKPGVFANEGISQARSFAFLAAFVQRAVKKQKAEDICWQTFMELCNSSFIAIHTCGLIWNLNTFNAFIRFGL